MYRALIEENEEVREVALDSLCIPQKKPREKNTKHKVIIFGGNITLDQETSYGYIDILKCLIPKEYLKNTTFESLIYSNQLLSNFSTEQSIVDKENEAGFYEIFYGLIIPEISEGVKSHSSSKIISSLKKITFFAHSAGNRVADRMFTELSFYLQNNNFSNGEIQNILSNIFLLSYAPNEPISTDISVAYVTPIVDNVKTWSYILNHVLGSDSMSFINKIKQDKKVKKCQYIDEMLGEYLKQYKFIAHKRKNQLVIVPEKMCDSVHCDHSPKRLIPSKNKFNENSETIDLANGIFNLTKKLVRASYERDNKFSPSILTVMQEAPQIIEKEL